MKFDVLYVDPPWQYSDKHVGGNRDSGAVDKYPVLSLNDLKNLKISEISEKNSVLFLWTTTPLLPDALDVMKSWGFKYKTCFVWEKTRLFGMGQYFRINTEFLLVGIRGKIKPFRLQEKNILQHPVLKHSTKPESFRQLVERSVVKSFDKPKMIEIFARISPLGWTSVGNEIDQKDIRDAIEDLIKI